MGPTTRSKGVLTDQTNVRRKSEDQAPKKTLVNQPPKNTCVDQAPKKICVYQSKEIVGSVNDDEMDVYHFEFDSKLEPKKMIKKRRARPAKTAVKRLHTNSKPTSKSKKAQKIIKSLKPAVRQNAAILSPMVHSTPTRHVMANISSNFEAHVPAALRKNPMSINNAVIISSPAMSAPLTPIHLASPIYQALLSPIHQMEMSPIQHDLTDNYVPFSPQNSLSRPESPPLANLFDDDDEDDMRLILPQRGPTRFEYNEIASARARVIRTSITPRNVVPLPPQPPRDVSPEPVGPKMKQTSILNYVKAPEEEGLFGSFSPVRASSPNQLSMLSPVRADACLENTRQDASEDEVEERCAPTRLSANTLRNVMQANKETLAKELPPSPKKRFFKVCFVFQFSILMPFKIVVQISLAAAKFSNQLQYINLFVRFVAKLTHPQHISRLLIVIWNLPQICFHFCQLFKTCLDLDQDI